MRRARPTRIYTRTGDDGTTALGDTSRAGKNDLRLKAYADVDEANSSIGVAIAMGGLLFILGRVANLPGGDVLWVPEASASGLAAIPLGQRLGVTRGTTTPQYGSIVSPSGRLGGTLILTMSGASGIAFLGPSPMPWGA